MKNEISQVSGRISLRPALFPADEDFLIELYYTTREDIHQAPLDEEQKRNLSLMQYQAQKQHYAAYYPGTDNDIILFDGKAVGRLWIARYEKEILGVDFAILPEYRNHKIGTKLLLDLFNESLRAKKVFNFHVLKTNHHAQRLYERLNCRYIGETPTHFKMQWQPQNEFLPRNSK